MSAQIAQQFAAIDRRSNGSHHVSLVYKLHPTLTLTPSPPPVVSPPLMSKPPAVRNPHPQLDRLVGHPAAPTSPSSRSLAAAPPPSRRLPPHIHAPTASSCPCRVPSHAHLRRRWGSARRIGTAAPAPYTQVFTGPLASRRRRAPTRFVRLCLLFPFLLCEIELPNPNCSSDSAQTKLESAQYRRRRGTI
jgi:hypothetical protein